MIYLYVVILIVIVGLAVFYIVWESVKNKKSEKTVGTPGILKNKKQIESMVSNVESIIVYANGNDELCRRLVEVKDNIRFFNPTTNEKVLLEEIEAYIVQRKKDEKSE